MRRHLSRCLRVVAKPQPAIPAQPAPSDAAASADLAEPNPHLVADTGPPACTERRDWRIPKATPTDLIPHLLRLPAMSRHDLAVYQPVRALMCVHKDCCTALYGGWRLHITKHKHHRFSRQERQELEAEIAANCVSVMDEEIQSFLRPSPPNWPPPLPGLPQHAGYLCSICLGAGHVFATTSDAVIRAHVSAAHGPRTGGRSYLDCLLQQLFVKVGPGDVLLFPVQVSHNAVRALNATPRPPAAIPRVRLPALSAQTPDRLLPFYLTQLRWHVFLEEFGVGECLVYPLVDRCLPIVTTNLHSAHDHSQAGAASKRSNLMEAHSWGSGVISGPYQRRAARFQDVWAAHHYSQDHHRAGKRQVSAISISQVGRWHDFIVRQNWCFDDLPCCEPAQSPAKRQLSCPRPSSAGAGCHGICCARTGDCG